MFQNDNFSASCSNVTPTTDHKNPDYCTTFKLVVDVYVVACLSFFGIIGNILSIFVLGREKRIRETAFLLQVIATADIMYLTTCLFFQSINAIDLCTQWLPNMKTLWPRMEPYVWPMASIAQTCTTWFVVLLTAERYVAICKPLTALMSEPSRLRRLTLLVFVVALLYNLPRFFERETRMETCKDAVKYVAYRTPLRNNKYYIVIYKTSLYLLLRYFVPISLLAFFNARLIHSILRSSKLQRSGSTRSRSSQATCHKKMDRKRFTFMLIAAVVAVSVLCGLPDFFLRIWISITTLTGRKPTNRNVLRYNIISNLFLTVNSSVNFLIYCVLGKKFRENLLLMVCRSRQQSFTSQAIRLRRIESRPSTSRNTRRRSHTSSELISQNVPRKQWREEELYG